MWLVLERCNPTNRCSRRLTAYASLQLPGAAERRRWVAVKWSRLQDNICWLVLRTVLSRQTPAIERCMVKKALLIGALLIIGCIAVVRNGGFRSTGDKAIGRGTEQSIATAVQNHASNSQVAREGIIITQNRHTVP